MRHRKTNTAPPKLAQLILARLFPDEDNLTTVGDFEEGFRYILKERSRWLAVSWYWIHLLLTLYALVRECFFMELMMILNYFKTAWRVILKRRVFSLINISGLSLGIAATVLIFLYVQYELGFDRHINNRSQIFRALTHVKQPNGMAYSSCVPFPMAGALRENFPDLEHITQSFRMSDVPVLVKDQQFHERMVRFVSPEFYDLFNVAWIHQDPEKGEAPHTVVLTERAAHKYFGEMNPLGQSIRLDDELDLQVAGVVANPPHQSSLPYDLLISWTTLDDYFSSGVPTRWEYMDDAFQIYFSMPEAMSAADVESRFVIMAKKYLSSEYAASWVFKLQSLRDVHFDPRFDPYPYATSRTMLVALAAIGLLILLIACINFINLSTAQAMKRAREMGMRKVLGADRRQLVFQLMGETGVLTVFSFIVALGLAYSFIPGVEAFLGNHVRLSMISPLNLLLFFAALFVFVNLLNGLYPALALSRYQPSDALKSSPGLNGKRSPLMRNSLVLFQFIVSQVLIVSTLIIASQIRFVGQRDLGFQKEGILNVEVPEYDESRCETLRSRWMANPAVQEVSFAWSAPNAYSDFTTTLSHSENSEVSGLPVTMKLSDRHYLDVYGIPLLAGSFFTSNTGNEKNCQFVVNEKLAKEMGMIRPADAVGHRVTINNRQGIIIGVIANFHGYSLKRTIPNIAFVNVWPSNHDEAQIRIKRKNLEQTLNHIRNVWENYYPNAQFEYAFLSDYVRGQYDADMKMLKMVRVASLLAVFIGCLGLLGLASFMAVQRTKEIGIRKVLGASMTSVSWLLARDFLKWVLLANLVGWPVAWAISRQWLQNFQYRIPLGIHYFFWGGILALGIAIAVVSVQVLRASWTNPVDSIKHE